MSTDRIQERLEVVEGYLRALEERVEVDEEVDQSADREDAVRRLTGSPLKFTQRQAHHILDMTISQRTQFSRQVLRREQEQLQDQLRRLSRK